MRAAQAAPIPVDVPDIRTVLVAIGQSFPKGLSIPHSSVSRCCRPEPLVIAPMAFEAVDLRPALWRFGTAADQRANKPVLG